MLFDTPAKAAIWLIDTHDFSILPLSPNSKIPCQSDWPTASRKMDSRTIENIYHSVGGELYNFGVQPAAGSFVLDIDCKPGKNGATTLAALEATHGPLPSTFTVRTASGGLHKYFRGQGCNSASKVGQHLDTKAENGQVVAPGSVIDGKQYAIISDDVYTIADAPQWLLDLMNAAKVSVRLDRPVPKTVDRKVDIKSAIDYLLGVDPIVMGGGTSDLELFKIFCQMRDKAISEEKAKELVLEHLNPRCEPPWNIADEADAKHFEDKCTSAYRYAENSFGAKSAEAVLEICRAEFQPVPIVAVPVVSTAIDGTLEAELEECAFDQDKPPVRTEPVLWIGDVGVAKPGDLVVLQAKVKAGKSSVVGAMMSSTLTGEENDLDFLGFTGSNPNNFPLLHIDTEQSREDHFDSVERTLSRAGLSKKPALFYSYCLTHFGVTKRKKALFYEAARLFKKYGGLCAIFIDGVGDLCKNLNDPEESNRLTDELYWLAAEYSCPVINVLHENPGTETGKTRGHFGSQLERKAASNLRLEKDGRTGIIQLWGDKLRRGHIGKGDGPSFMWSHEQGRHVSCASVKEVDELEEAHNAGPEKQRMLGLLRKWIPDLGVKKKASELIPLAVAAKCKDIAPKERPERFVKKIWKRLLGDETEFKYYRERGVTGTYMVERLAIPSGATALL